ncbi:lytic murein transglycosylase [Actinopolyspora saharensis]|uniref:lytic transglycosylase domain-containing protein n=1 Tax=Actinopolyspora saharensis TaxID=995062 RepID=UPI003F661091
MLLLGLLLPFVLVGGANALTGAWFASRSAPADSGAPRVAGATGRATERQEPGVRLLRDSAELRDPSSEKSVDVPDGPLGVPEPMLRAYRGAAREVGGTDPSCGLHWSVLAAIGRAESGHARSGQVDETGTTATAILGPRLDGGEDLAAVPDTDSGELDGDPVWDRAIGPMQFLPTTWRRYGADGDGDGARSPHNAHDAALAAARYLCDSGGDLNRSRELARAVFRYNHSESYVREVLGWATAYRTGVLPVPANPVPEVDEVALPEVDTSSGGEPAERTEEGVDSGRPGGERKDPERTGAGPEFPPLSPAPAPTGDSGRESFPPLVPAPSRDGGAEGSAGAERPSRTRVPEAPTGDGTVSAEPSRTSQEPAPTSAPSGNERERVSSAPEPSAPAAPGA